MRSVRPAAPHHDNIPIIIEHLDEAGVPRASSSSTVGSAPTAFARPCQTRGDQEEARMGELYGRALTRHDVSRHAGMLSQFAGCG